MLQIFYTSIHDDFRDLDLLTLKESFPKHTKLWFRDMSVYGNGFYYSSNAIHQFIPWICLYNTKSTCSTFKITAQSIKRIGCRCCIIAMITDMLQIQYISLMPVQRFLFCHLYKIMYCSHTIILSSRQIKLYLTLCTTCLNSYSCFHFCTHQTFIYSK